MASKMWYLTSDNDNRIIYVYPEKLEIVIGRSPDPELCDFTIHDDVSISRRHAVLKLGDTGLNVKDLGSRYGTFINNSNKKLENDSECPLKNNDIVKLGKMKCVWRVNETNFVTCTSTLKGENLQILKQVLSKIGGQLKNEWDDSCEYLTMPAITLTIKVVLALVQGSYIVTTEFWSKCVEVINANSPLPNPKDFRPDILESTLNKDLVSFLPDKRRISLFAGKKFIFFSKRQFDMYKAVLYKGNAIPLFYNESTMSKPSLCDENTVVIQYNFTSASQETEAQRNHITEVVDYLKSNGKRVIADPEIGLAVLNCSTAKYCNPNFNFSSEVVKQTSTQQSNKILAPETQETVGNTRQRENVIINESLLGNNSKRKISDINDDDFQTSVNKKLATGNSSSAHQTSVKDCNKRKHDDEEQSLNPTTKKMAIDNDDNMFNFVTPKNTEPLMPASDKLNLAKPQKRKADFDNGDDDLFNFVQNENSDDNSKRSMFEDKKTEQKTSSVKNTITSEEISAMRGAKLAELNNANIAWNPDILKHKIKQEKDDSLDEKMSELDIGSVLVTVNASLIKKEPIEIEDDEPVKNFKKFKKVWPLRKQITVIPKSSMIIKNDDKDTNSLTNNSA